MFEFNLTQYKENISEDPFENITETIQQSELLQCDNKFFDYTSDRVSTNTYSMMIQYNYSPQEPVHGCNMDWKINFYNKYNDMEILDQVNYDIWIVDENNNKIYSYAESIGKEKLFNQFGQVDHLIPVEKSGLVRYAIFVHGLGPEDQVNGESSGYTIIEVPVEENPLLKEIVDEPETIIPEWIKNNAKWWAEGAIDDTAFIQGIEFLVREGIIQV
jgi:hypothetical protein